MKSLNKFKEFNPGKDYPSMKEFFCHQPYEHMEEIALYLEHGSATYVTASYPRDIFTGERIPGEKTGMTDGEYNWSSVLPYYVRRYNLRLPEEFEKKVLKLIAGSSDK